MRKTMMFSLAVILAALQLAALEVPLLTPEQEAFLKMSPAERRERFTNEAYRAALAQNHWERMKWREAAAGESSRWRHLPGIPNMRDLGGLRGMDGKTVVCGKIFRSGGFNNNACKLYREEQVLKMHREGTLLTAVPPESLETARIIQTALDKGKRGSVDLKHLVKEWCAGSDRLNESGREFQIRNFGIKTDLDLRTDRECYLMTGSPLGPQVRWVHNSSGCYGGFHDKDGKAATKRNFALFLDEKNYPIGFHCIAGADRTGSLAYLLEALLGVSEEDLVLDWELTAFHNPKRGFAHAARYDKLVAGFDKYPGANAREKAEGYVKSLGFTDEDITKFRRIMLK